MPWRYIIFTIVILTAAGGASKRIAVMGQENMAPKSDAAQPFENSEPISGRSIAPGGAGGRQS